MILPIMLHKESSQVSNAIQELKISMLAANIDRSMLCLKQLVAGTPYSTQKKEIFVFEEHLRFILKNIFYLCGFKVSEEQQMSAGRIDLVVETSENIYIIPWLLLLCNERQMPTHGTPKSQIQDESQTQGVDFPKQWLGICQEEAKT